MQEQVLTMIRKTNSFEMIPECSTKIPYPMKLFTSVALTEPPERNLVISPFAVQDLLDVVLIKSDGETNSQIVEVRTVSS